LTQYAAKNWLGAVNEGVGLEMLYCALLERLASQDKDLTIEGSSTLLKALAQQRWLRESTRSNNNSARFAHELISESAKRWFAIKLSEMEATKRGPKSHK
jgi:hypothetical protein